MADDNPLMADETRHVFVVSGRRGGEFCGVCGLHWTDECHVRSSCFAKGDPRD